ncbi:SDR family oxidoreductase [Brooklawnia sp.]|uniref:SDR family NAD(P)-dependent oxidoreductase n=1 Tax=Brooklawnia sp. TaxID=2699740 RepID=UPI00311F006B
MILDLTDMRVLVTGGGVGIGLGIVKSFAEHGAQVAFTWKTHQPDEALLDEIAELGGKAPLAFQLDATDEAQVNAVVARAAEALGGLDVLVNNAGGMVQRSTVDQMPLELWHAVMDVNLTSCFLVTKAALNHLSEGSSIINVASLAGQNGGGQGASAYGASKAAMLGLTKAWAKEFAPRQIRVNAVAPGLILDTPFHEQFNTAQGRAAGIESIPLRRPGYPSDIAGPVLWLADPQASGFVSGATIDINGAANFS